MTEPSPSAIRELRISVVQNGLIVTPREPMYRDGYGQDCYVFQTVEQLAAWMLKQVWSFQGVDRG